MANTEPAWATKLIKELNGLSTLVQASGLDDATLARLHAALEGARGAALPLRGRPHPLSLTDKEGRQVLLDCVQLYLEAEPERYLDVPNGFNLLSHRVGEALNRKDAEVRMWVGQVPGYKISPLMGTISKVEAA